MNLKVLVTGANGFIGSTLVKKLLKEGFSVRCLVHRSDHRLKNLPVEFFRGSILDNALLKKATQGVDLVYHLAGRATDWGKREAFFRSNSDGTRKIVNSSIENGVRRLVFSSSLAVHKFTGHVDSDETTPTDQEKYAYGASKAAAEKIVNYANASGKIETVIVRPGVVVFGPEDTTAFVHMAPMLERGRWGHVAGGRPLLCYSYVDNLVSGMLLAGTHAKAAGETFILTDDLRLNWKQLISAVISAFGVKEGSFSAPASLARAAGIAMESIFMALGVKTPPPITHYRTALVSRDFHFSCDKAKKILGYSPHVGFEEGLAATIRWWKEFKRKSNGR